MDAEGRELEADNEEIAVVNSYEGSGVAPCRESFLWSKNITIMDRSSSST